jgi:hypothetical protein
MSFSSNVKEELMEHTSSSRHCRIAELTAILLMAADIQESYIGIKSENLRVIKKFSELVYRLFQIPCQVRVRIHKTNRQITTYAAIIPNREQCGRILQTCKLSDGRLNRLVIQMDCCKRAFLRGAFLTSGSLNHPEKSYHFEIACETEALAKELQNLWHDFGIEAKIVLRKKYYIVYIKEAEMIVDALNVMEAHKALMEMENIRILKDVRNHTNRKVNCDLANINKIVTSSQHQIEDIRYIEQVKGLQYLKKNLREVAELRIEEPELSLKELGELLQPPVSKSGVNHRLKKISEIACLLRNESHF